MRQPKSLLHARILEYGLANLANALGVSATTVSRWVNTNHVPASRIKDLGKALDLPLYKLLSLTENVAPTQTTPTRPKPPGTLATLMEVHRGMLTLEDAAKALDTPFEPLKKAYELNEARLPLLYNTIKAYTTRRIKRAEAMKVLGVSPAQFHYLLRIYGEKRPQNKKPPVGKYLQNKPLYEKVAMDVIAGRTNARSAAQKSGLALRTLHRYVTQTIDPRRLSEITHWPLSFRAAWALELENRTPKHIERLVELAKEHGLTLEKRVRLLKLPENWREAKVSTLLRVVLYGEKTLEEVAILRGGSLTILKNLFNGVLKPLNLRYSEVTALSVMHQIAIADFLTMLESHYRRDA